MGSSVVRAALTIPAIAATAVLVVSMSGSSPAATPRAVVWPTNEWTRASPEAHGIASSELAAALEFARDKNINIHSLTVVRDGVMVLDAYFYPFTAETRHDVASVTKSVVSMLTGIAIADGHLSGLQQPILSALPRASTREAPSAATRIRIADLLAMQSGLDCGLKSGEPELRAMRGTTDWVAFALRLPTVAEPGTRFGYCSPNVHLLSAAIATASKRSTLDYARERLFAPLGIKDVYWPADSRGINHGWGDLQLRPHDMAKIGLLMLRDGHWHDRQILPTSWIKESVASRASVSDNESYGLGWWISKRVPTLFEANGRGGQRISIVPAKNLVVVMTGGGFEPGDIGAFLQRAIRSDDTLPEDRAGQMRLADALRLIGSPPPRHAPTTSVTAGQVSSRVYRLDENALGVTTFSVAFADRAVGRMRLQLANGEGLVQPLGLDGQYRTTSVNAGAVSAGRGEWLPDGRLRIEFNRLSLINRFIFDVEFLEREVQITASEPTELGTATLRGRWRP